MSSKPEPQVLSISGIQPKPVHTPDKQHDWAAIASLPPFQMFMNERYPDPNRADSYLWAISCLELQADDELLQEYCEWHKAKGYWPNETPTGGIVDGS